VTANNTDTTKTSKTSKTDNSSKSKSAVYKDLVVEKTGIYKASVDKAGVDESRVDIDESTPNVYKSTSNINESMVEETCVDDIGVDSGKTEPRESEGVSSNDSWDGADNDTRADWDAGGNGEDGGKNDKLVHVDWLFWGICYKKQIGKEITETDRRWYQTNIGIQEIADF